VRVHGVCVTGDDGTWWHWQRRRLFRIIDLVSNATFGPNAAGNRGGNGLLLWGRDIRAAVGAPEAPGAVRHSGVALLPSMHERAAEQASAEAVLRLQTAHTAARLDVGAHLHKFAAGGAPELAAGGAAIVADTRRSNGRLHLRRVGCNPRCIHHAFLFPGPPESDGWPDHATRGGGVVASRQEV
jgi:hypothetical protein